MGGQDDQVFDGSSMVLNPGGRLMAQLPQFDECEVMVTFRRGAEGGGSACRATPPAGPTGLGQNDGMRYPGVEAVACGWAAAGCAVVGGGAAAAGGAYSAAWAGSTARVESMAISLCMASSV